MDTRLLDAAQTGNVQILRQLLVENPFILYNVALPSIENPVHICSFTGGHADFVKEILKLRPIFAQEINQDGFSPLHLASANGHLEIVKELLILNPKLCRIQGRNNWTPLHYAASRGRVDVIREMLLACPESIEDLTVQKETALHLAVKNCQFIAISFMMKQVREMNKHEVLNFKDECGNSILHLATWRKQQQVIEWLLSINETTASSASLIVNDVNNSDLTALDLLLIFPSEAGDREIECILRNAGAKRAREVTLSPVHSRETANNQTSASCAPASETQSNDELKYFEFKKGRDSPGDVRDSLLIIAVLVATATFQVGLNPPSGVWQDTNMHGTNDSNNPVHLAGKSIMGSYSSVAFIFFVVFNSIGFSVSLFIITILTFNFPLLPELQICFIALYTTYNTAMVTIAPDSTKVFLTAFTASLPIMIPIVNKWIRKPMVVYIRCMVNLIRFFRREL